MKKKEATHTPGPWTNNDSYDSVIGADGEVVCHTFGAVDPVDRLNAILIAAAPEMLEALKVARDMIEEFYTLEKPHPRNCFCLQDRCPRLQVDRAIAKATGKEEGR